MKQYKELEIHTYGDSKAEETLVAIINQQQKPYLAGFVTRVLQHLSHRLKSLSAQVTDKNDRAYLARAIKFQLLDQLEQSKSIATTPEIKTYMINAIVKRLRKFSRGEYLKN